MVEVRFVRRFAAKGFVAAGSLLGWAFLVVPAHAADGKKPSAPAPQATKKPKIDSVAPRGANPGRSVAFDVKAADLGGNVGVWTTFPQEKVEVEPVAGQVDRYRVRMEVSVEAPVGLHWLRLHGTGGVAPPARVLLDPYRTEPRPKDPEPSTAELAKPLPMNAGVEGAIPKGGSHFFRVAAKKGERVFVDCWAERFGSSLDPLVRILNAAGDQELAWGDDSLLGGKDAQLAWLPEADGEALLELRDSKYEGGASHRYRLRAGRTPAVAAVVPTGVPQALSAPLTPLSDFPLPLTGVAWTASADESGLEQIEFAENGGPARGWGWIVVGPNPEFLEPELPAAYHPNGNAEEKSLPKEGLPIPCGLTGRLTKPREQDRFPLALDPAERLVVRGLTRGLGLAPFLKLLLLDAAGKEVARGVDQENGDARLEAPAKLSGPHTLVVGDVAHRGGPTWVYRLELDYQRPSVSVVFQTAEGKAEPIESVQAVVGAPLRVKLGLQRKGFDGEVKITAALNRGGRAEGRVEAKKNDGVLELPLPDDAKPGDLLWLEAAAGYEVDGKPRTARAETSLGLEKNPFRRPPQSVWGRRLAVGVVAAEEKKPEAK